MEIPINSREKMIESLLISKIEEFLANRELTDRVNEILGAEGKEETFERLSGESLDYLSHSERNEFFGNINCFKRQLLDEVFSGMKRKKLVILSEAKEFYISRIEEIKAEQEDGFDIEVKIENEDLKGINGKEKIENSNNLEEIETIAKRVIEDVEQTGESKRKENRIKNNLYEYDLMIRNGYKGDSHDYHQIFMDDEDNFEGRN